MEQIDLYQLHMPDVVQPLRNFGVESSKDDVYWRGLAECHRLGLVKNVGVSNYGPTLLVECQETLARHGVPLASNQIAYSLIGRHNGAQETVDKCRELGVAVLACYPFAMVSKECGIGSKVRVNNKQVSAVSVSFSKLLSLCSS